jgi:hypothetical protein
MITFIGMKKLQVGDTIFCLRSEEIHETPYTLCRIPSEVVPALMLRYHGDADSPPMNNSIDIAWKDTGTTHRLGADRCFPSEKAARMVIRSHVDYLIDWLLLQRDSAPAGEPVKATRSHKKKARRVTRDR